MTLTPNQKKYLNKADQKLRGARKDLDIVFKEEDNQTEDKLRRQETVGPDGCAMEVQKSNQD